MKRRHRVCFFVIIIVVTFCLCGCAQDENWTDFLETAVLELVQTGELQVTEEVLAEQEESRLQEAESGQNLSRRKKNRNRQRRLRKRVRRF